MKKNKKKKTDDEVHNEENQKKRSINELKEIAKLRRIKDRGKFKKISFNY